MRLSEYTLHCSAPEARYKDDWLHIHFDIRLARKGYLLPIYVSSYTLGTGHLEKGVVCVTGLVRFKKSKGVLHLSIPEFHLMSIINRGTRLKDPTVLLPLLTKIATVTKLQPSIKDVLCSCVLDGSAFFDAMTFEEWADNYGYSSDSIKAKEAYDTCMEIGLHLTRTHTERELKALRRWANLQ